MKKMKDTRYMVTLAMMAAIVVLLANTPLGMIQLPVIKATTVHIPVIIGSILLGPGAGAILAFFRVLSLPEHDRTDWRPEGPLGQRWLPCHDRCCLWLGTYLS